MLDYDSISNTRVMVKNLQKNNFFFLKILKNKIYSCKFLLGLKNSYPIQIRPQIQVEKYKFLVHNKASKHCSTHINLSVKNPTQILKVNEKFDKQSMQLSIRL